MWPGSYASFTRISLRFHNGRFTRPLPFLHGYLQFKLANSTIAGFNGAVKLDEVIQKTVPK